MREKRDSALGFDTRKERWEDLLGIKRKRNKHDSIYTLKAKNIYKQR